MSDVNRTQVIYKKEATWGTPPAPDYNTLRLTSGSLKLDTNTTVSQEIRSDRQEADLIRTGLQGSGDIGTELSYGAHEDLQLAALQAASFAAEDSETGLTISFASRATVGGNYARMTRSAGDWNTKWAVGDIGKVAVDNIAVPANAVFFQVAFIDSATIMRIRYSDLTDSATDAGIKIQKLGAATNGVTFQSFTFEAEAQDVGGGGVDFTRWTGYSPDTWNMTITPEAIITAVFGFLGKLELSAGSSLDSTPVPATTGDVMSAVANVVALIEGDDPGSAHDCSEFTMAVRNNLAARLKIGLLGPTGLRSGTFGAEGTLKSYYLTKALMDKYRSFTTSMMLLVVQDALGNAYALNYPKVKFSAGASPLPGINQDRMNELNWRAVRHPTLNYTMKLAKGTALT